MCWGSCLVVDPGPVFCPSQQPSRQQLSGGTWGSRLWAGVSSLSPPMFKRHSAASDMESLSSWGWFVGRLDHEDKAARLQALKHFIAVWYRKVYHITKPYWHGEVGDMVDHYWQRAMQQPSPSQIIEWNCMLIEQQEAPHSPLNAFWTSSNPCLKAIAKCFLGRQFLQATIDPTIFVTCHK